MKKLVLFCLLLASLHVRADLVVVQTVETADGDQNFTMKIKGDRMRTDLGDLTSTITDLKTGDTITLIHGEKKFIKLSGATTKKIMKAMKEAQGVDNTPPLQVLPLGKKDKVGNFNAELYSSLTPSMKFIYWMSTDIPNYPAIRDEMKKMQSARDKMGEGLDSTPDTSSIEGFPVKTQVIRGSEVYTTLFVSAKEQPIDDAEFAPPLDYIEIKMPDAPAPTDAPKAEPVAPKAVPVAPAVPKPSR